MSWGRAAGVGLVITALLLGWVWILAQGVWGLIFGLFLMFVFVVKLIG
jgi:hypothetical protein